MFARNRKGIPCTRCLFLKINWSEMNRAIRASHSATKGFCRRGSVRIKENLERTLLRPGIHFDGRDEKKEAQDEKMVVIHRFEYALDEQGHKEE